MSLGALMLRFATVNALKGQTFAGDNVLDTPIQPGKGVVDGSKVVQTPSISVFTNDSHHKTGSPDPDSGDVASTGLVLQIFLPTEIQIGTGATGEIGNISGRNAGGALIYDLMQRQVERALQASTSSWAIFFRKLVLRYVVYDSLSFVTVNDQKIVEIVSRELNFRIALVEDPEFFGPPSALWSEFLGLVGSLPNGGSLRALMEQNGTTTSGFQPWEKFAADLAANPDVVAALGLGPAGSLPNTENPVPTVHRIDITKATPSPIDAFTSDTSAITVNGVSVVPIP